MVTGDVVAQGLTGLAYACGVALINIFYLFVLWKIVASPRSVEYLESATRYLIERPLVSLPLAILSYFVFLLTRSYLGKKYEQLQKWALRGLKGTQRSKRKGTSFILHSIQRIAS